MDFELEALVGIRSGQGDRFTEAVLGLLRPGDFKLMLEVHVPGTVSPLRVVKGGTDVLGRISSVSVELAGEPVEIRLQLIAPSTNSDDPGDRLLIGWSLFGPGYFDRRAAVDEVKCDGSVLFLLSQANWAGRGCQVGPDGPVAFLFDLLEAVCKGGPVSWCAALQEQKVIDPLSFPFSFHDRPSGFCSDLRDIATLAYRGGAGSYTDLRRHDAPLIDEPASSLLFAGRPRHEVDRLKARLRDLRQRIEGHALPDDTSRAVIEAAAEASRRYLTFTTQEGGIGVGQREAAFDGFLDDFYLDLLERLL
jgi:hypothetical protein